MGINLYVLMTYGLTAVISFAVIGVIVGLNKLMNGKDSEKHER